MNDYYHRLGIHPGASASEVKKAYRTLAHRYHPDVNASPEAQQLFLAITEAYHQVLGDLHVPLTDSMQDTTEGLYHPPYRFRKVPIRPSDSTSSATSVPLVVHVIMAGLVWGMSLFFILIPFFVCYQLLAKGVNGWPSLAFFPLVIGGVCGVYQSARSGKRLLQ